MAGFVRVAPATALVARGGLAFAELALDHAELRVPNVALTPGRIPRQRHHPRRQSQHSVTTAATPPSTSRTTTSPRAIEVTLAVASGTESRIGSGAAAMAVRHLERGILHSRGPTLSAPPWRRLPSRCPEVAAPAHIDVMRRAVASRAPRLPGRPSSHLEAPSGTISGRARTDAAVGVRIFAGRVSTGRRHGDADEALRIASGCIPRAHGPEAVDVRPTGGGLSQPGASAPSWPITETGDGLPGPRVHRSLQPGPCGPCSLPRGNAPRNSSPNRTEADR